MATVLPDDPRLERCGFCKLHGPDFEFFSKRYDIQIGRRSKSAKLDVVLGALPVPPSSSAPWCIPGQQFLSLARLEQGTA